MAPAHDDPGLPLAALLGALDEIAPPSLAEPWDNVGLLLSPSEPRGVRRVLLAIDATDAVVEDAISQRCEALVAYHPPLFEGAKRLIGDRPETRRLVRLLEARIAVASPHTALDAAPGGLNDWLAEGAGEGTTEPIGGSAHAVPPKPGIARLRRLAKATSLAKVIERVKRHLGIDHARLARPAGEAPDRPVRTVAVCAGAGGSVLKGARADLLVTGEMRHHDVLDALSRGQAVLLCEHSASERGYLPVLAGRLSAAFPGRLDVRVSVVDREPLGPA